MQTKVFRDLNLTLVFPIVNWVSPLARPFLQQLDSEFVDPQLVKVTMEGTVFIPPFFEVVFVLIPANADSPICPPNVDHFVNRIDNPV